MVKHSTDLISQAFNGFQRPRGKGTRRGREENTLHPANGVNFRSFVDYLRGEGRGEAGQAFFELSWNRLFEKLGRRCRA